MYQKTLLTGIVVVNTLMVFLIISCKKSTAEIKEIVYVNIDSTEILKTLDQEIEISKIADPLATFSEKASVIFRKNRKSYISDTIHKKYIGLIIFGNIDKIDISKNYLYTYIDSIRLIYPIDTTFTFRDPDSISGYLYKSDDYSFEGDADNKLIRIKDIDQDNQNDFEVYCGICSGSSGRQVYNQFIIDKRKQSILRRQKSY